MELRFLFFDVPTQSVVETWIFPLNTYNAIIYKKRSIFKYSFFIINTRVFVHLYK